MIIEISGIDGSGKSTLADHLARWAHEAGIPCFSRPIRSTYRRILDGIATGEGHPSWRALFDLEAVQLATALEVYQVVCGTVVPIDFARQIIICENYGLYWLATAASDGVSNLPELSRIFRLLPEPALSLHLSLDVDTAYSRILARSKGDHILRTGGRQRLARLADAYEQAIAAVSYRPEVLSGDLAEHALVREAVSIVLRAASAIDADLHSALQRTPVPALR